MHIFIEFHFHFSFVIDAPVVTMKMGKNLNPDTIKENDGVYFECQVKANPKPYKMAWFYNVSTIKFSREWFSDRFLDSLRMR